MSDRKPARAVTPPPQRFVTPTPWARMAGSGPARSAIDASGEVTHSRRGLHGRVVDVLGAQIITGDLPTGLIIDVDQLIGEMQISRTVVREAFKVLTAKGLLDARPHTGTFVLDRSRWNLLDADVIRWRNASGPDAQLLRELEEVRQIVEPWGSRLAAERRTEEQLAAIREAFEELAATQSADMEATATADVRFHRLLLASAGNELLDRLEGLLEPMLRARDIIARHGDESGPSFVDYHRTVVERVEARDGQGAFDAMTALLRGAAADTEKTLGDRDQHPEALAPMRKTSRQASTRRRHS